MEPSHNLSGSDPNIMHTLGSIEARLTAIDQKLDRSLTAHDKRIEKLETKVDKLEQGEIFRLGAAAAISFIVGLLSKAIQWQNLF